MKANGARVIITAEYLVETFGPRGYAIALQVFAIFISESEDKAFECFAYKIAELEEQPRQKGRKGAIDFWKHLRSAYEKLSVFERSRIRADLPRVYADYLKQDIENFRGDKKRRTRGKK